jgi:GntR family transcriptional regulator, transcriptional repressor for pyruvate dehydrogenase complex
MTVEIEPINRARIHEQVIKQLQNLMQGGKLQPGDRLPPERELAQRFGVSRVAIRQALSVLQAMGLVQSRVGDGTFAHNSAELTVTVLAAVIPGPQGTVGEQVELRRIIEPQVAELAALRAGKADIVEMKRCLEAQRAKFQAGLSFVDEDAALHLAIARATKNHLLVRMIEGIHGLLRDSRNKSLQTANARELSLRGHQGLIAAIQAKKAAAAGQAMRQHLTDVEKLAGGKKATSRSTAASHR